MEEAAESTSTVLKHPSGMPLTSGEKILILNVYEKFFHKFETLPVNDIMQLTADLTGVSSKTVYKVRKEKESTGTLRTWGTTRNRGQPVMDKCNEVVMNGVRAKVRNMLLDNVSPTTRKVLDAVNSDPDLPSFKMASFCRVLQKIGIQFPKCWKQRKPNSKFWKQQMKLLWDKTPIKTEESESPNVDNEMASESTDRVAKKAKIDTNSGEKSLGTRNMSQKRGEVSQTTKKCSPKSVTTQTVCCPENPRQECAELCRNKIMNTIVDDLHSLVHYILKGSATLSPLDEPTEKIWTIQGPKKNVTVRIHYRNDGESTNAGERDENGKQNSGETASGEINTDIQIKQEPDDDFLMDENTLTSDSVNIPSNIAPKVELIEQSDINPEMNPTAFDLKSQLPRQVVTQPTICQLAPCVATMPGGSVIPQFVYIQTPQTFGNVDFILSDVPPTPKIAIPRIAKKLPVRPKIIRTRAVKQTQTKVIQPEQLEKIKRRTTENLIGVNGLDSWCLISDVVSLTDFGAGSLKKTS